MRYLIISNTYYQLIFAIQLKMTVLKDKHVSMLISDHSNGAEKYSNPLTIQTVLMNRILFVPVFFLKKSIY